MPPPSFTRINEVVSVQYATPKDGQLPSAGRHLNASAQGADDAASSPKTILFLSWADADARHIEKYTRLYNELYPRADIILVESSMVEFFLRPAAVKRRLVQPVVQMLLLRDEAALHVHIMSNGASKQWCTIDDMLRAGGGGRCSSLAAVPTVLDSTPGCGGFRRTWAAVVGGLPRAAVPRAAVPRAVLVVVLGPIFCALEVARRVLPGPDALEVVRRRLNAPPPPGDGKGCGRRCYIYSEEDEMIGWEDVEEHAREAGRKGWSVELVKVDGSGHVGHLRRDPDGYKAAVERTWRARAKL
ncbi:DUF829 domain protein (PaxU) [Cordyceps fumosorosea ARSEF 2679]|uniref:DUF829 domain protein (PaxU) n=1 Tax=Cordyceps fumosorosea (strain ARSEF 2679) TaxID=1081104 RepID=A0A167N6D9_CORFA|nr:DUF829 domain protein (PaxU) [Cordyceps fumosorosea ARSEF 2679]OAA55183.1 DUF829 domain protein (PaxU) [Cordyceps fumosorosea ARSEF 2679]